MEVNEEDNGGKRKGMMKSFSCCHIVKIYENLRVWVTSSAAASASSSSTALSSASAGLDAGDSTEELKGGGGGGDSREDCAIGES